MSAARDSGEDLRELYRELILDHARSPRHFGKLPGATHSAEGINPLCGDKLKLYIRVGNDEHIDDACFEGTGCAISVASASLLTDKVVGMTVSDALAFLNILIARLSGQNSAQAEGPEVADLGKLRALEGVKDYPSRVKCATLAWQALHSAFQPTHEKIATTE